MALHTHALTLALAVATTLSTATATPTPSPEPAAATGPGIAGFLVTFALVVACIPLFLSMTRKIRGVRYRDQSEPGEADDAGDAAPSGPDAGPRP